MSPANACPSSPLTVLAQPVRPQVPEPTRQLRLPRRFRAGRTMLSPAGGGSCDRAAGPRPASTGPPAASGHHPSSMLRSRGLMSCSSPPLSCQNPRSSNVMLSRGGEELTASSSSANGVGCAAAAASASSSEAAPPLTPEGEAGRLVPIGRPWRAGEGERLRPLALYAMRMAASYSSATWRASCSRKRSMASS
eukprot:13415082-Alexandrium_andersonii.AAC.2